MAIARLSAGGAVVAAADASAHRMLVVGGEDLHRRALDSCELYDAVADRWSLQEARLPQAMCCRAASIAGGSAVLAVQCDDRKNTRCARLDVRSSSSCWQSVASPQLARTWSAVVAVSEHCVLMHCGSGDYGATDTAQVYDVRADRWSQRPEWRPPMPTSGHRAVVVE